MINKYFNILLLFLISLPAFAHHEELFLSKSAHDFMHLMFDFSYVVVGFVVLVLLVKKISGK